MPTSKVILMTNNNIVTHSSDFMEFTTFEQNGMSIVSFKLKTNQNSPCTLNLFIRVCCALLTLEIYRCVTSFFPRCIHKEPVISVNDRVSVSVKNTA